MKISLHQTGGIFGADRTVDLVEDRLRVRQGVTDSVERRLTNGETAKVGQIARRLIVNSPSQGPGPLAGVSDSTLTHLEVADADETRLYSLRSGEAAPDEVWELIATLGEVADAAPAEG